MPRSSSRSVQRAAIGGASRRLLTLWVGIGLIALCLAAAAAPRQDGDPPPPGGDRKESPVPAALDFTMNGIDGKPINLADYRGKVVLMVNVASQCGYTRQYEGLQALHKKYEEKGLVVLGFPANDFGKQEPGTNEEIIEFCTRTFDVKFQMFEKVSVKGETICDLYKLLTDKEKTPASEGDIKWNFEKFLLDHEGKVVKHYRSKATPESMAADIEKLLAKIPPTDG